MGTPFWQQVDFQQVLEDLRKRREEIENARIVTSKVNSQTVSNSIARRAYNSIISAWGQIRNIWKNKPQLDTAFEKIAGTSTTSTEQTDRYDKMSEGAQVEPPTQVPSAIPNEFQVQAEPNIQYGKEVYYDPNKGVLTSKPTNIKLYNYAGQVFEAYRSGEDPSKWVTYTLEELQQGEEPSTLLPTSSGEPYKEEEVPEWATPAVYTDDLLYQLNFTPNPEEANWLPVGLDPASVPQGAVYYDPQTHQYTTRMTQFPIFWSGDGGMTRAHFEVQYMDHPSRYEVVENQPVVLDDKSIKFFEETKYIQRATYDAFSTLEAQGFPVSATEIHPSGQISLADIQRIANLEWEKQGVDTGEVVYLRNYKTQELEPMYLTPDTKMGSLPFNLDQILAGLHISDSKFWKWNQRQQAKLLQSQAWQRGESLTDEEAMEAADTVMKGPLALTYMFFQTIGVDVPKAIGTFFTQQVMGGRHSEFGDLIPAIPQLLLIGGGYVGSVLVRLYALFHGKDRAKDIREWNQNFIDSLDNSARVTGYQIAEWWHVAWRQNVRGVSMTQHLAQIDGRPNMQPLDYTPGDNEIRWVRSHVNKLNSYVDRSLAFEKLANEYLEGGQTDIARDLLAQSLYSYYQEGLDWQALINYVESGYDPSVAPVQANAASVVLGTEIGARIPITEEELEDVYNLLTKNKLPYKIASMTNAPVGFNDFVLRKAADFWIQNRRRPDLADIYRIMMDLITERDANGRYINIFPYETFDKEKTTYAGSSQFGVYQHDMQLASQRAHNLALEAVKTSEDYLFLAGNMPKDSPEEKAYLDLSAKFRSQAESLLYYVYFVDRRAFNSNPYYFFSWDAYPERHEQFIQNLVQAEIQIGRPLTRQEIQDIGYGTADMTYEAAAEMVIDLTNVIPFMPKEMNEILKTGAKKIGRITTWPIRALGSAVDARWHVSQTVFMRYLKSRALRSVGHAVAIDIGSVMQDLARNSVGTKDEFIREVGAMADLAKRLNAASASVTDPNEIAKIVSDSVKQFQSVNPNVIDDTILKAQEMAKVVDPDEWVDIAEEAWDLAQESITKKIEVDLSKVYRDAESLANAVNKDVVNRMGGKYGHTQIAKHIGDIFRGRFYRQNEAWVGSGFMSDTWFAFLGGSGKAAEDIGKTQLGLRNAIQNIYKLDTWLMNLWVNATLARRPAWMIYNYIDNTFRLIFESKSDWRELQAALANNIDEKVLEEIGYVPRGVASDVASLQMPTHVEVTGAGKRVVHMDDMTEFAKNPLGFFQHYAQQYRVLSEGKNALGHLTAIWEAFPKSVRSVAGAIEYGSRLRLFYKRYLINMRALNDANILRLATENFVERMVATGMPQEEALEWSKYIDEMWEATGGRADQFYKSLAGITTERGVHEFMLMPPEMRTGKWINEVSTRPLVESIGNELFKFISELRAKGITKLDQKLVNLFFDRIIAMFNSEAMAIENNVFTQMRILAEQFTADLPYAHRVIRGGMADLSPHPAAGYVPVAARHVVNQIPDDATSLSKKVAKTVKKVLKENDIKLPKNATDADLLEGVRQLKKRADWQDAFKEAPLTPEQLEKLDAFVNDWELSGAVKTPEKIKEVEDKISGVVPSRPDVIPGRAHAQAVSTLNNWARTLNEVARGRAHMTEEFSAYQFLVKTPQLANDMVDILQYMSNMIQNLSSSVRGFWITTFPGPRRTDLAGNLLRTSNVRRKWDLYFLSSARLYTNQRDMFTNILTQLKNGTWTPANAPTYDQLLRGMGMELEFGPTDKISKILLFNDFTGEMVSTTNESIIRKFMVDTGIQTRSDYNALIITGHPAKPSEVRDFESVIIPKRMPTLDEMIQAPSTGAALRAAIERGDLEAATIQIANKFGIPTANGANGLPTTYYLRKILWDWDPKLRKKYANYAEIPLKEIQPSVFYDAASKWYQSIHALRVEDITTSLRESMVKVFINQYGMAKAQAEGLFDLESRIIRNIAMLQGLTENQMWAKIFYGFYQNERPLNRVALVSGNTREMYNWFDGVLHMDIEEGMTGQEILDIFKSRQTAKIPQEELDWYGLEKWLSDRKTSPVKKQELKKFMDDQQRFISSKPYRNGFQITVGDSEGRTIVASLTASLEMTEDNKFIIKMAKLNDGSLDDVTSRHLLRWAKDGGYDFYVPLGVKNPIDLSTIPGVKPIESPLNLMGTFGSTKFLENHQAVVKAFGEANMTTALHELFHAIEPWLPADTRKVLNNYARESLEALKKSNPELYAARWAPYEKDGKFSNQSYREFIAVSFEKFIATGTAPNSQIKSIFTKIKNTLINLYHNMADYFGGVVIPPEVRKEFERLIDDGWKGRQASTKPKPSAPSGGGPSRPPDPAPSGPVSTSAVDAKPKAKSRPKQTAETVQKANEVDQEIKKARGKKATEAVVKDTAPLPEPAQEIAQKARAGAVDNNATLAEADAKVEQQLQGEIARQAAIEERGKILTQEEEVLEALAETDEELDALKDSMTTELAAIEEVDAIDSGIQDAEKLALRGLGTSFGNWDWKVGVHWPKVASQIENIIRFRMLDRASMAPEIAEQLQGLMSGVTRARGILSINKLQRELGFEIYPELIHGRKKTINILSKILGREVKDIQNVEDRELAAIIYALIANQDKLDESLPIIIGRTVMNQYDNTMVYAARKQSIRNTMDLTWGVQDSVDEFFPGKDVYVVSAQTMVPKKVMPGPTAGRYPSVRVSFHKYRSTIQVPEDVRLAILKSSTPEIAVYSKTGESLGVARGQKLRQGQAIRVTNPDTKVARNVYFRDIGRIDEVGGTNKTIWRMPPARPHEPIQRPKTLKWTFPKGDYGYKEMDNIERRAVALALDGKNHLSLRQVVNPKGPYNYVFVVLEDGSEIKHIISDRVVNFPIDRVVLVKSESGEVLYRRLKKLQPAPAEHIVPEEAVEEVAEKVAKVELPKGAPPEEEPKRQPFGKRAEETVTSVREEAVKSSNPAGVLRKNSEVIKPKSATPPKDAPTSTRSKPKAVVDTFTTLTREQFLELKKTSQAKVFYFHNKNGLVGYANRDIKVPKVKINLLVEADDGSKRGTHWDFGSIIKITEDSPNGKVIFDGVPKAESSVGPIRVPEGSTVVDTLANEKRKSPFPERKPKKPTTTKAKPKKERTLVEWTPQRAVQRSYRQRVRLTHKDGRIGYFRTNRKGRSVKVADTEVTVVIMKKDAAGKTIGSTTETWKFSDIAEVSEDINGKWWKLYPDRPGEDYAAAVKEWQDIHVRHIRGGGYETPTDEALQQKVFKPRAPGGGRKTTDPDLDWIEDTYTPPPAFIPKELPAKVVLDPPNPPSVLPERPPDPPNIMEDLMRTIENTNFVNDYILVGRAPQPNRPNVGYIYRSKLDRQLAADGTFTVVTTITVDGELRHVIERWNLKDVSGLARYLDDTGENILTFWTPQAAQSRIEAATHKVFQYEQQRAARIEWKDVTITSHVEMQTTPNASVNAWLDEWFPVYTKEEIETGKYVYLPKGRNETISEIERITGRRIIFIDNVDDDIVRMTLFSLYNNNSKIPRGLGIIAGHAEGEGLQWKFKGTDLYVQDAINKYFPNSQAYVIACDTRTKRSFPKLEGKLVKSSTINPVKPLEPWEEEPYIGTILRDDIKSILDRIIDPNIEVEFHHVDGKQVGITRMTGDKPRGAGSVPIDFIRYPDGSTVRRATNLTDWWLHEISKIVVNGEVIYNLDITRTDLGKIIYACPTENLFIKRTVDMGEVPIYYMTSRLQPLGNNTIPAQQVYLRLGGAYDLIDKPPINIYFNHIDEILDGNGKILYRRAEFLERKQMDHVGMIDPFTFMEPEQVDAPWEAIATSQSDNVIVIDGQGREYLVSTANRDLLRGKLERGELISSIPARHEHTGITHRLGANNIYEVRDEGTYSVLWYRSFQDDISELAARGGGEYFDPILGPAVKGNDPRPFLIDTSITQGKSDKLFIVTREGQDPKTGQMWYRRYTVQGLPDNPASRKVDTITIYTSESSTPLRHFEIDRVEEVVDKMTGETKVTWVRDGFVPGQEPPWVIAARRKAVEEGVAGETATTTRRVAFGKRGAAPAQEEFVKPAVTKREPFGTRHSPLDDIEPDYLIAENLEASRGQMRKATRMGKAKTSAEYAEAKANIALESTKRAPYGRWFAVAGLNPSSDQRAKMTALEMVAKMTSNGLDFEVNQYLDLTQISGSNCYFVCTANAAYPDYIKAKLHLPETAEVNDVIFNDYHVLARNKTYNIILLETKKEPKLWHVAPKGEPNLPSSFGGAKKKTFGPPPPPDDPGPLYSRVGLIDSNETFAAVMNRRMTDVDTVELQNAFMTILSLHSARRLRSNLMIYSNALTTVEELISSSGYQMTVGDLLPEERTAVQFLFDNFLPKRYERMIPVQKDPFGLWTFNLEGMDSYRFAAAFSEANANVWNMLKRESDPMPWRLSTDVLLSLQEQGLDPMDIWYGTQPWIDSFNLLTDALTKPSSTIRPMVNPSNSDLMYRFINSSLDIIERNVVDVNTLSRWSNTMDTYVSKLYPLFINPTTRFGTANAYLSAAGTKPMAMYLIGNGYEYITETLGEEVGEFYLKTLGDTIRKSGISSADIFHAADNRLIIHAETAADLDRLIQTVDNAPPLRVFDQSGNPWSIKLSVSTSTPGAEGDLGTLKYAAQIASEDLRADAYTTWLLRNGSLDEFDNSLQALQDAYKVDAIQATHPYLNPIDEPLFQRVPTTSDKLDNISFTVQQDLARQNQTQVDADTMLKKFSKYAAGVDDPSRLSEPWMILVRDEIATASEQLAWDAGMLNDLMRWANQWNIKELPSSGGYRSFQLLYSGKPRANVRFQQREVGMTIEELTAALSGVQTHNRKIELTRSFQAPTKAGPLINIEAGEYTLGELLSILDASRRLPVTDMQASTRIFVRGADAYVTSTGMFPEVNKIAEGYIRGLSSNNSLSGLGVVRLRSNTGYTTATQAAILDSKVIYRTVTEWDAYLKAAVKETERYYLGLDALFRALPSDNILTTYQLMDFLHIADNISSEIFVIDLNWPSRLMGDMSQFIDTPNQTVGAWTWISWLDIDVDTARSRPGYQIYNINTADLEERIGGGIKLFIEPHVITEQVKGAPVTTIKVHVQASRELNGITIDSPYRWYFVSLEPVQDIKGAVLHSIGFNDAIENSVSSYLNEYLGGHPVIEEIQAVIHAGEVPNSNTMGNLPVTRETLLGHPHSEIRSYFDDSIRTIAGRAILDDYLDEIVRQRNTTELLFGNMYTYHDPTNVERTNIFGSLGTSVFKFTNPTTNDVEELYTLVSYTSHWLANANIMQDPRKPFTQFQQAALAAAKNKAEMKVAWESKIRNSPYWPEIERLDDLIQRQKNYLQEIVNSATNADPSKLRQQVYDLDKPFYYNPYFFVDDRINYDTELSKLLANMNEQDNLIRTALDDPFLQNLWDAFNAHINARNGMVGRIPYTPYVEAWDRMAMLKFLQQAVESEQKYVAVLYPKKMVENHLQSFHLVWSEYKRKPGTFTIMVVPDSYTGELYEIGAESFIEKAKKELSSQSNIDELPWIEFSIDDSDINDLRDELEYITGYNELLQPKDFDFLMDGMVQTSHGIQTQGAGEIIYRLEHSMEAVEDYANEFGLVRLEDQKATPSDCWIPSGEYSAAVWEIPDEVADRIRIHNEPYMQTVGKDDRPFATASAPKNNTPDIDEAWRAFVQSPILTQGDTRVSLKDLWLVLFNNNEEKLYQAGNEGFANITERLALEYAARGWDEHAAVMRQLSGLASNFARYIEGNFLNIDTLVPPYLGMWRTNPQIRDWFAALHGVASDYENGRRMLEQWRDGLSGYIDNSPLSNLELSPAAREVLDDVAERGMKLKQEMQKVANYGGEIGGVKIPTNMGAVNRTNDVMIDYTKFNNIDQFMRQIIPFWMYPAKSISFWVGLLMEHPELVSFYMKYMRWSDAIAWQHGAVTSRGETLPSLKGYMPIGPGLWFNPLSPLFFRYAFPRYDEIPYTEEEEDVTPVQHVAKWLLEDATLFGINISPATSAILRVFYRTYYPKSSATYEAVKAFIPIEFIPPFFERWIMEKTRQVAKGVPAGIIKERFIQEVAWKDYLIERQILITALERMQGIVDEEEKLKIATRAFTVVTVVDREENPEWIDARKQIEGSEYFRRMAGMFTGIYAKEFSPGQAELYQLRNEVNELRDAINDEAQAVLFHPYMTQADLYNAYTDRVYETPEGWTWHSYKLGSYVTNEEGDDVVGEARREVMAQDALIEEQTSNYYEKLKEMTRTRDEKLAALPVGLKDARQDVWTEYFEELAQIDREDAGALYPLARKQYYIGYKPFTMIEEYMRGKWWREIKTTYPSFDEDSGESFENYEERVAEWYKELPRLASILAPVFQTSLRYDIYETNIDTESRQSQVEGMMERLIKETNEEGYKEWQKANDTMVDAIWEAYQALYIQPFYDAVKGKVGIERDLAEIEFYKSYPLEPKLTELVDWINTEYGAGRWSSEDLLATMRGLDYATLKEIGDQGKTEIEEFDDMVWDIMTWAGPQSSENYKNLVAAYESLGGYEDDFSIWKMLGSANYYPDPEDYIHFRDRLFEAAKIVDYTKPTEQQLRDMLAAKKLNDQFQIMVEAELGGDFYTMLGYYSKLDSNEREIWRKENKDLYARISKYYQMKNEFAELHPEWVPFYYSSYEAEESSAYGAGTGAGSGDGYYSGGSLAQEEIAFWIPMGKRASLNVMELLTGRVGKGGYTGRPWWPDRLRAIVDPAAIEQVDAAAEGNAELTEATINHLVNVAKNHPEYADTIRTNLRYIGGGKLRGWVSHRME